MFREIILPIFRRTGLVLQHLLIKYIKSVLWRVAKCLSYIEDARFLKVKLTDTCLWGTVLGKTCFTCLAFLHNVNPGRKWRDVVNFHESCVCCVCQI